SDIPHNTTDPIQHPTTTQYDRSQSVSSNVLYNFTASQTMLYKFTNP
ncbi:14291_t:CDS:1, partial [Racocetra persica]